MAKTKAQLVEEIDDIILGIQTMTENSTVYELKDIRARLENFRIAYMT